PVRPSRHLRHRHGAIAADAVRSVRRVVRERFGGPRLCRELPRICLVYRAIVVVRLARAGPDLARFDDLRRRTGDRVSVALRRELCRVEGHLCGRRIPALETRASHAVGAMSKPVKSPSAGLTCTDDTDAAGGPRRAQAIIASTSAPDPEIMASTLPSRRLRTQPARPRACASSAKA